VPPAVPVGGLAVVEVVVLVVVVGVERVVVVLVELEALCDAGGGPEIDSVFVCEPHALSMHAQSASAAIPPVKRVIQTMLLADGALAGRCLAEPILRDSV